MPLILHRTRNLGVTGVKRQFTVGPFINRDNAEAAAPASESEPPAPEGGEASARSRPEQTSSWNPFSKC